MRQQVDLWDLAPHQHLFESVKFGGAGGCGGAVVGLFVGNICDDDLKGEDDEKIKTKEVPLSNKT